MEPTGRFNHVAMSVAREQVLDAAWRRQVADFFGEVFGWQDVTYPPGNLSTQDLRQALVIGDQDRLRLRCL
jgi:hypothetical protein